MKKYDAKTVSNYLRIQLEGKPVLPVYVGSIEQTFENLEVSRKAYTEMLDMVEWILSNHPTDKLANTFKKRLVKVISDIEEAQIEGETEEFTW